MCKKLLLIIIIIITLMIFTGCWDSTELSSRAIVAGVGIDKTIDNKIELTVQIISPGGLSPGEEGNGSSVLISTVTGETLFQAVRAFTKEVSKKLYWEQNRIIVFSEEVARNGILPYIDFFMRDHEVRKRSWILVTDGKASDIIKTGSELSKIPANEIIDLIKAQSATSEAAKEDLFHLALKLSNDTTCPVATHIGTHEPLSEDEKSKMPKIIGSAMFKNDIFVDYLNEKESRGYHWITNQINSGIIVVKSPSGDNSNISIEIHKSVSKMKPVIKDGAVSIEVKIRTDASIGDVSGEIDLSKEETFKQLGESCKAVIVEEINSCLLKSQKQFGTDIFGFGDLVHHYLPNEWKKIKETWLTGVYKNVEVNLDIEVEITHSGLYTKPVRD